jgi:MHS family proline/betaine transporter-like MFS transporter
MGPDEFSEWGWRIPFLLSALLVGISIIIRVRMQESPLFAKIKAEGKTSANPLKESFTKKENLKLVLLALFGATAGQGVVWYTGQFYALSFIQKTCSVEFVQSNYIIAAALILGTPLFIYFGWLSDRVGRKAIMMLGLLGAIILYRPIYGKMYELTDTNLMAVASEGRQPDGSYQVSYSDGSTLTIRETSDGKSVRELVLGNGPFGMMVLFILIQVVLVTMVYGPIAAFLVELFPTRIRYTSMSLPYHIGNGVFGGLTPFIATYLATRSTGDPYVGLIYPIGVAALSFIVGMIFLSNKRRAEVNE